MHLQPIRAHRHQPWHTFFSVIIIIIINWAHIKNQTSIINAPAINCLKIQHHRLHRSMPISTTTTSNTNIITCTLMQHSPHLLSGRLTRASLESTNTVSYEKYSYLNTKYAKKGYPTYLTTKQQRNIHNKTTNTKTNKNTIKQKPGNIYHYT